jgi:very-short-patch-repair endonuclease
MDAIQKWINEHLAVREGDRNRRLKEGFRYAEESFVREIWWPAFGDLTFLHPEFEVVDVLEGRRFIDFAYLRDGVKIGIEIDGYGPHLTKISRDQFSNQFLRDMQLRNLGWSMIHLSADDTTDRPSLWRRLLQQFIGITFGAGAHSVRNHMDIELLTYLFNLHRPFKRHDIEHHLHCSYALSRQLLASLRSDGWIEPHGGGKERVHTWKLTDKFKFLGMPFSTGAEANRLFTKLDRWRVGKGYRK